MSNRVHLAFREIMEFEIWISFGIWILTFEINVINRISPPHQLIKRATSKSPSLPLKRLGRAKKWKNVENQSAKKY
jgi:hypothetical protein